MNTGDRTPSSDPPRRESDENIRVLQEVEGPRGWTFTVRVPGNAGGVREASVHLAFVDYELWSHGTSSPARVAEVVVRVLMEAMPEREIPTRLDASSPRRWVAGFDGKVREML